jgi:hypothetical protein
MTSKTKADLIVTTGKKVIAHDVVSVRPARSGDYAPMIISIPKKIVDVMKLRKSDQLRIYTDGERIYLDRLEAPTI